MEPSCTWQITTNPSELGQQAMRLLLVEVTIETSRRAWALSSTLHSTHGANDLSRRQGQRYSAELDRTALI